MRSLFWISAFAVLYTFAGYPLLLYIRSRVVGRAPSKASVDLSVSAVIAVHNEESTILRKIANLQSLKFAQTRLEIIVVSDGSTDSTSHLLRENAGSQVHVLITSSRAGKAAALNLGFAQAKGDILLMTDSRQVLEPEALNNMLANYADDEVGGVSGLLMLGNIGEIVELTGEKLKWNIENSIREWEGATGSVVGALGAFYSIRRELYTPIPVGTLLDDMFVPLHVVRQKRRIVFEKTARAWDDVRPTPEQEFKRKVRTLTGNYQLVQLAPWLLSLKNPILFEYLSHKIMRLLVPFALILMLVASFILKGPFFRLALISQLVFYVMALLPMLKLRLGAVRPIAQVAHTFFMLNVAALIALSNFVSGKKDVWTR